MTRNDALGPPNGEDMEDQSPIFLPWQNFKWQVFACVKKMGLYWLGEYIVLKYNLKHGHFKKVHS
jgi:hypothetical protein